jgi:predicted SAM-dependent methyltransferase
MDVSQPWCYDDNTVDYITSEHMLEHIPSEKNLFALQEAHRVLKVGGVIRTIVPNKKFYEELRGKDDHPFVTKYNQLIMKRSNTHNLGNEISRRGLQGQGHVWVPTEKMLIDRHREAGFDEVKIVQYNESDHKVLNGIDLIDGLREMESIVCEAIKT